MSPSLSTSSNDRLAALKAWLNQALPGSVSTLESAAEDGSFRRYYRVCDATDSYIVMDSPLDKVPNFTAFIILAQAFKELGLNVPEIFASEAQYGFVLMTDFGDQQYLRALNEHSVEQLYGDALQTLSHLQLKGDPNTALLPVYDHAFIMRELAIFEEWFLQRYCAMGLKDADKRLLQDVFEALCENALMQPQVWMHRDFHARNLMVTTVDNPGVLDFQDAVLGPLTYDLVSLLRDCYIRWPVQRVQHWVYAYRQRLYDLDFVDLPDESTFLRWFDWMGLQRHLKAVGIFARLKLRDGKSGYLRDIPRTLGYIFEVAQHYPELERFAQFLRRAVPEQAL